MIPQILSKILDELNQPSPRLDYIRGMVEVLLASEAKPQAVLPFTKEEFVKTADKVFPVSSGDPEADILNAKARASLETIKAMANIQND